MLSPVAIIPAEDQFPASGHGKLVTGLDNKWTLSGDLEVLLGTQEMVFYLDPLPMGLYSHAHLTLYISEDQRFW